MKSLFYSLLSVCSMLLFACSTPSTSAPSQALRTFKVWGNCDQCKETIEEAAFKAGASNVVWSEESTLLSYNIDTTVITDDTVLKAVANAGYDNERYTADDNAYHNLPECCQYERKAK